LSGAGPAEPSLGEFNPLFVRDRLSLLASGIVGGNATLGDELVLSGIWGKASFSLGQFHYETDGFRQNNDLKQDLYSAFVQVSPSHKTSFQTEIRSTNTKKGDRELRFINGEFDPTLREKREIAALRLGFHHAFSPGSDIIASLIYKDVEDELRLLRSFFARRSMLEERGYLAEGQHLFRSKGLNLVSGLGHFTTTDRKQVGITEFLRVPGREVSELEEDIRHTNAYVYSQINYLKNLTLTLGVSTDFFKGASIERDQFNPKAGLTWEPFSGTTLRAAVFRALKRRLTSDQTIEPTQVAGFNQFFDDSEGTEAWRYGIAIDQKFPRNVYGGVEFSKRDLEVPGPVGREIRKETWDEYLTRAYIYWTPHPWLAASAEYQFERFERGELLGAGTGIVEVDTHRFPLGINFFHPSGFSAGLRATYVDQDGRFAPLVFVRGQPVPGADHFWVVDATLRYRLPKRHGFITLGVENLFDEGFNFQDTDPANPLIQPDRLVFFRLTLAF